MPLNRLGEIAKVFFKLGIIGFGGPVAHISMIEDEVVKGRQYLTREYFWIYWVRVTSVEIRFILSHSKLVVSYLVVDIY